MIWLFRKWCEWSHVHSWYSIRLYPTGFRMCCEKCGRVWRTKYYDEAEASMQTRHTPEKDK